MSTEQAVINSQWNAAQEAINTEWMRQAPHVLMRPSLSIDGDKWCALYGENLQDGLSGFGNSPAEAMSDFDANWRKPIQTNTGDSPVSNEKVDVMRVIRRMAKQAAGCRGCGAGCGTEMDEDNAAIDAVAELIEASKESSGWIDQVSVAGCKARYRMDTILARIGSAT